MQKSVQVRTPLYAAAYWQQAADEFKNIRVLAFAGMVTALAIILESFPIYLLGQSLKIYFSFVVFRWGAPVMARWWAWALVRSLIRWAFCFPAMVSRISPAI